ncbi:hypothetical protein [Streptomyces zaomyceticus]|uniref:hypothetical protein n=1 Tax=Streptomyces zaomyceticus TaxID=68286 RepID=UPI002E2498E0
MPVTLDKTPKLHQYLAVVAYPNTVLADVHHVVLTRSADYGDQFEWVRRQCEAVENGVVVVVIAGDRSEAYREARRPDLNEDLMARYIDQERLLAGL